VQIAAPDVRAAKKWRRILLLRIIAKKHAISPSQPSASVECLFLGPERPKCSLLQVTRQKIVGLLRSILKRNGSELMPDLSQIRSDAVKSKPHNQTVRPLISGPAVTRHLQITPHQP
jgi:hypothetical protein